VLDAAHIQPYLGPRSNHLQNGILLTKESHTLFDLGYVTMTPDHVIRVPGGAVVQIPVADFRTPKGASIEGHGVQPDRRVFETRAGLLAGHDVMLDAALEEAKASHPL
jgi:hypothetical protein